MVERVVVGRLGESVTPSLDIYNPLVGPTNPHQFSSLFSFSHLSLTCSTFTLSLFYFLRFISLSTFTQSPPQCDSPRSSSLSPSLGLSSPRRPRTPVVEKRCPSGTCGGGSGINGVDGVIAIFADIKAQLVSLVPALPLPHSSFSCFTIRQHFLIYTLHPTLSPSWSQMISIPSKRFWPRGISPPHLPRPVLPSTAQTSLPEPSYTRRISANPRTSSPKPPSPPRPKSLPPSTSSSTNAPRPSPKSRPTSTSRRSWPSAPRPKRRQWPRPLRMLSLISTPSSLLSMRLCLSMLML